MHSYPHAVLLQVNGAVDGCRIEEIQTRKQDVCCMQVMYGCASTIDPYEAGGYTSGYPPPTPAAT